MIRTLTICLGLVVTPCALSEPVKPQALVDSAALAPEHRVPAEVVIRFLAQRGEDPKDFFVKVITRLERGELEFDLWHKSAFEPRNRGSIDYPGGIDRTIFYSTRGRKVILMVPYR